MKLIEKIKDDYSGRLINNPTGYFYDLSIIRKNVNKLQNYLPSNVHLYYAMKANPNDSVMKCIQGMDYVKGLEIASSGELKCALNYYDSSKIIFTGPGKTDFELEAAILNGIRFINVESVVEAIRINNIARRLGIKQVDVLIRINLDYTAMDGVENMTGCSTKMGIDECDYIESFKYISSLEHICVRGIHVFAASGVLDYQILIDIDRYIFELVNRTHNETGDISVIDFGGGLGIDYSNENKEFDVKKYSQELDALIETYGLCDKEIIMELGTYVVGNAGYYTAKIIDIKQIKGKKHIIIAGGVNHMGLPLEMQRKHPVFIIPMNVPKLYPAQPSVSSELADISGPLCMVSDKLCWDEYIEKAEIGDIVVFRQSGAYCYGEGMHDFLMHEYPPEIIYEE